MEQRKAPEGILCTKTHEWILEENKNSCVLGITDYAVEKLGDILSVDLPEVGTIYSKNEPFASVESVKGAYEIFAPISGKIVDINEKLISSPEIINEDNWTEGYLVRILADDFQQDSMELLEYDDYIEETD